MSKKVENLWWIAIFVMNIAIYTLAFTNPSWLGGI